MADIKKYIEKSWLKMNGKLFKIDFDQYGCVLILSKGEGEKRRLIAFKVDRYDSENLEKCKTFKLKSRIKIKFFVKSAEYKGRWYTDLILKDISEWKKNEKTAINKEKMQDLFEQSEYTSLNKHTSTFFNEKA